MKLTFEVQGLAELAANLEKLAHRYSRRILLDCLREAAEPLRQRMEELAPRGPVGPVHLAEAMTISLASGQDIQEAAVAVGPAKGETFYGGLVEYGTAKMPARPFARPAFDAQITEMLDILREALWRQLVGVTTVNAPSAPTSGGSGAGI